VTTWTGLTVLTCSIIEGSNWTRIFVVVPRSFRTIVSHGANCCCVVKDNNRDSGETENQRSEPIMDNIQTEKRIKVNRMKSGFQKGSGKSYVVNHVILLVFQDRNQFSSFESGLIFTGITI
jgi:hypothetical protein